jgi:hypothetical protein
MIFFYPTCVGDSLTSALDLLPYSSLFHLQLMKHYTFPNLSDSAQAFTAGFFQLISSLAETFVYVYHTCVRLIACMCVGFHLIIEQDFFFYCFHV